MNQTASSLVALLFILTGCNTEIEQELHVREVPILIAPKQVETSLTKAVTTAGSFSQGISNIGVVAVSKDGTSTPDGISPTGTSGDYLQFGNTALTYPADGSEVTLYGYYPCESQAKKRYMLSEDILNFTLTGQEDLMWAQGINAGTKASAKPVELSFAHKLARISFTITNQALALPALPTGTIAILAQGATSGIMRIKTGNITAASATDDLVLETETTIATVTSSSISNSLYVLPAQAYSFFLKIDGIAYPIKFDGDALTKSWNEGEHYTLSITIKGLTAPNLPLPNASTPKETMPEQPLSTKSHNDTHHSITGNITL